MNEHLQPDEIPCDVLINGVPFRSVHMRNRSAYPHNFDVVVTEPMLGQFALHAGFDIDVRESDSVWRRVSLGELKGILTRSASQAVANLAKAAAIAEYRLFARVDDIQIPDWESEPHSVLRRLDACVRYVQRIFYRAGIPHLIAGTTFTVPSAPTARIPLKRAGFRQSEISPSALVEPRTGCAIQLVERDQM